MRTSRMPGASAVVVVVALARIAMSGTGRHHAATFEFLLKLLAQLESNTIRANTYAEHPEIDPIITRINAWHSRALQRVYVVDAVMLRCPYTNTWNGNFVLKQHFDNVVVVVAEGKENWLQRFQILGANQPNSFRWNLFGISTNGGDTYEMRALVCWRTWEGRRWECCREPEMLFEWIGK